MTHNLSLALHKVRRPFVAAALALFAIALGFSIEGRTCSAQYFGTLEKEVRSDYSFIRIRKQGNVRTLIFVRDSGEEAIESQVDIKAPHELRFAYLRHMFLSYVLRPEQEKVLVVGLGGGSMIHFLRKYHPEVNIDVVEIDPAVVRLAADYFLVKGSDKVNITTGDGLEFLANCKTEYDVIYMDAFLKPSAKTDDTGVPLALRTKKFYQAVQTKLKPDGMVVFNLNSHDRLGEDIKTIRSAFPQTYVFVLPTERGVVAVGSTSANRVSQADLIKSAQLIDRRFKASFKFQDMAKRLEK